MKRQNSVAKLEALQDHMEGGGGLAGMLGGKHPSQKKEDGVVYIMEGGKWKRKPTAICTIA